MLKIGKIHWKDALLLSVAVLPVIAGIVLRVLTEPESTGITVAGAKIFFTIPMPLQNLPITEAQIHSWLVLISVFGLCLFLTRGLKEHPERKRQIVAEWIVQTAQKFTNDNMGARFAGFAPFIAAIMGLSAASSLLSLFGLFPPTSDVNVVAGWAIVVFVLITYYKLKGGLVHYLRGFAEPIFFFAPFNVVSEFATPVSMTFRHYGNILSGTVISTLVLTGLRGLSSLLFSWLPGLLGEVPWLQIGLPGILSIYFDLFSGCLQAFIFAMLTMLNISMGFPEDADQQRRRKLAEKQRNDPKTRGACHD